MLIRTLLIVDKIQFICQSLKQNLNKAHFIVTEGNIVYYNLALTIVRQILSFTLL